MTRFKPRAFNTARRPLASALLTACTVTGQAAVDPDDAPLPVLAASAAPSAAAPPSAARFSFYGMEPAAAGQTQSQAEAALGQPFKPEPKLAGRAIPVPVSASASASGPGPACQYQGMANHPGVRFTVAAGVLSRAETRDARYATLSGVRVGDTVSRARQIYGKRLNVGPHPYFDKGQTLTVYSPDRRFALVMESNNSGHIITLRGGRMPDVAWLEGCS